MAHRIEDDTCTIILIGETYRVRDEIKALGYRWDADNKQWDKHEATAEDVVMIDRKIYYEWNGVERAIV